MGQRGGHVVCEESTSSEVGILPDGCLQKQPKLKPSDMAGGRERLKGNAASRLLP